MEATGGAQGGSAWKVREFGLPATLLMLALAAAGTAAPVPGGVPQTGADRRACRPEPRIDVFIPGLVDPALTRLFTPQGRRPVCTARFAADRAIERARARLRDARAGRRGRCVARETRRAARRVRIGGAPIGRPWRCSSAAGGFGSRAARSVATVA